MKQAALLLLFTLFFTAPIISAYADEDECGLWEDCAEETYSYDSPLDNADEEDAYDFYHEKKESRIDRLNERPNNAPYDFSNTSRNTDKTLSDTVLRGLETR